MRERYRSILDRNRAWLEEELLIDPFFEHCVERGILTGNDRERIAAFPARPDRVLKFLDILRYKPDDAYDRFLELLGDPKKGQPHIKQHLESTEVPEASGISVPPPPPPPPPSLCLSPLSLGSDLNVFIISRTKCVGVVCVCGGGGGGYAGIAFSFYVCGLCLEDTF